MMHTKKPVRKPDVTIKDIGDETLLYGTDEQAIHVLNPTARLIWSLCDGQHTLADMEQAVHANFAVPEGRNVREDIQRTLDIFAGKNLLQEPLA
jgi:hypothetical protein